MPSQSFAFKKFLIHQDKCAMKVGTDAVLLGSWVNAVNPENMLDIGTGTGIISLMLGQRFQGNIDAIDIDGSAYLQALENIENCGWGTRIRVYHTSFQDFLNSTSKKYDLIVTNHPYFTRCSKARGQERHLARHNDLLPFCELTSGVASILKPEGRFCLVLPYDGLECFVALAKKSKLYLTRLTRVKTTEEKSKTKRVLMQFEKSPTGFSEDMLIIEKNQRHQYTEEYKNLTREFYLNF
jgi:tRNA1Val (adenine37-N6)-methyltransferase